MDLSIIVPVYNVEQYIRTCIKSIFRQDLDEERFEVIIINDGTTDNSIDVIQDIINQHCNITIINQVNQGLSVARNNGIATAKGEYILMPDSDDMLVENSIKPLLDLALKSKADLIVADFLKMTSEEIDNSKGIILQEMTVTEKNGWQMLLEDLNPYECYVWRTLYRRQFIISNHLNFLPGIRFQDVPFTHEVYLKAGKCIQASWFLNIYRKGRDGAATTGFDLKKAKDFCKAIGATWKLTYTEGLPAEIIEKITDSIHANITSMIYSMLYTIHDTNQRIKVIKMLRQEVPDLNFNHNFLQRVETILFWHSPYLYIIMREIIWKCKNL